MENEKRIPSQAREALCWVAAVDDTLSFIEKEFTPLALRVENGLEDFQEAKRLLRGLLVNILDTIPLKQLVQIRTQLEHIQIRLVPRKAPIIDQNGVWTMDIEELSKLASSAIDIRCTMCSKTAGEHCDLRDIIDGLPVEVVNPEIYMNCKK